jgi:CDP-4-dehydro-6-deoxyglucose reductase, E3
MFRVVLEGSGHSFMCRSDENVLAAGLAAGFMLPYSCRSGLCRTCKSQVVEGSVIYPDALHEHYLSTQERDSGVSLLCQARPASDLVVRTDEIVGMDNVRPRKTPCRIISIERVASDIVTMRLRLPMNENIRFFPGQHISFLLSGGQRRDYSIANPCTAVGVSAIELHIRKYPNGLFTGPLFAENLVGRVMQIELPLGSFFLRTDGTNPIIFMATGTGFAPVKAMMEQAVSSRLIEQRRIYLYWGSRFRDDLYMYDLVHKWAHEHPNFHFIPVISRPDSAWDGRVGHLQDSVLSDHADLSVFDIYACGSVAMIRDAREAFNARANAAPARFFTDEFLTAADAADNSSLPK